MKTENFGKNMKQILNELELNQTEFAQLIGITQAGVSQILSGERTPSIETVIKILEKIPVKFERLFR